MSLITTPRVIATALTGALAYGAYNVVSSDRGESKKEDEEAETRPGADPVENQAPASITAQIEAARRAIAADQAQKKDTDGFLWVEQEAPKTTATDCTDAQKKVLLNAGVQEGQAVFCPSGELTVKLRGWPVPLKGYSAEGGIALTPEFFAPRWTDCDRQAAVAGLTLCAQGQCVGYATYGANFYPGGKAGIAAEEAFKTCAYPQVGSIELDDEEEEN